MEEKIRVRYAPSPTGFLHIGGARSALFNYLFAKKYHGKIIFRVEDTDVERNVEGGEQSQYNDLRWLGIIPDESPYEPNPQYAPYRQMERLDIYHKYAQMLLDQGKAYYCYCTNEELEERKEEQLNNGVKATKYDRKCLNLTPEQKEQYIKEGRKPCIRIKLKDHEKIEFDDLVRGHVSFTSDDLGGDFVIMKSNGIPTYNFAVVIDDHLMEITHVLRGEEHLSNTPKQIALYRMFNWEPPKFGHMTIIVNQNGKKLSKRDHNILQFMSQYRDLGYLPEAIVNYILLLGWTPTSNQEIFSLKEAEETFDPSGLSTSPSMFDPQKMIWFNSQHIRKLSDEDYLSFIKPYMGKVLDLSKYDDQTLLEIALLYKDEIGYGEAIVEPLKSIIEPSPITDEEELNMINSQEAKIVYESLAKELSSINEVTPESIKSCFKNVTNATSIKGKNLYMPVRLKLTGVSHGIELVNIIKILGKNEVINRLTNN
jgi:nondiscriminating glutamyl-tRNA synthetase